MTGLTTNDLLTGDAKINIASACRYSHEAIDVITVHVPALVDARGRPGAGLGGRVPYGTLIPTVRSRLFIDRGLLGVEPRCYAAARITEWRDACRGCCRAALDSREGRAAGGRRRDGCSGRRGRFPTRRGMGRRPDLDRSR